MKIFKLFRGTFFAVVIALASQAMCYSQEIMKDGELCPEEGYILREVSSGVFSCMYEPENDPRLRGSGLLPFSWEYDPNTGLMRPVSGYEKIETLFLDGSVSIFEESIEIFNNDPYKSR